MINSVVLMGRLTHEPELQATSTGKSVTRFQIAVDRKYTPSGEERKADFISIVAWQHTAEFVCRYFYKGSMIALEGSIQTDSYTDSYGNKVKNVIVVASSVSFCESRQASSTVNTPEFEEIDKVELPWR